ncbi:metal ABC transporter permease [Rhodoferax sp.]|uniref:metal ABC transporter permease n=1 Tax=Rhodoferax sp. TaxID=50421 RepID=UPI00374CF7D6
MAVLQHLFDLAISPFAEFLFMRRALVSALALALGAAPLGVLLTLRRMSLFGEALSHAILPGVALGFMFFGLSAIAMTLGGLLAGMLVAAVSGLVSRATVLREDASLAALYLVSLALGVMLVSRRGTQLDLLHILFGSALGVDASGLTLVAGVATLTVGALALFYRAFLLESFDPAYLQSASGRKAGVVQQGFLLLVVLNLVAGFQTLGTLMAVGIMMLPAVSARLWHDTLPAQMLNAVLQAALASYVGLLLSYHLDSASGPTVIVCAGALYALSLLFAPRGWLPQLLQPRLRSV